MSSKLWQPEVMVNASAALGEGPSWDDRAQVLYWVDTLGKRIHSFDPVGCRSDVIQLDEYVGAVVTREEGGILFAGHQRIAAYDPATGTTSTIAELTPGDPDLRFNDGKCDPAGRLWVGTTSLTNRERAAALYMLDGDALRPVQEGVSVSNGLGWSPDGGTMYYIDTPTQQVAAYNYDPDTGRLADKRIAVDFSREEGWPDGMTLDEEGMLWIAHYAGYQVSRWNPATGDKLFAVRLPAPNVTSCVFAGKDRSELYVTTAAQGMSGEERGQYPQAGSLFRILTDLKGAKTHRCRV
ncbi:Sugar lactone lactonase YvrE [Paenibacillus sp. UNCCL117]|uniref:SMP-30/gluconolactonase/LRE family protein n=1 Tax=unclassified Paenibacillus TaxID=185978 RepID=UPI00088EC098|nr:MULTISPECIES: SMP-30/gluconolactonase/LRE family protein [unclassified Paenibacillus]SDD58236.1 Sugar lactone lactonase YvrE [Paenibacillus sp. cl123]SFW51043.1 Sugar lactone lactonase YvrE [Paenibacillus sp. UNCCL117]